MLPSKLFRPLLASCFWGVCVTSNAQAVELTFTDSLGQKDVVTLVRDGNVFASCHLTDSSSDYGHEVDLFGTPWGALDARSVHYLDTSTCSGNYQLNGEGKLDIRNYGWSGQSCDNGAFDIHVRALNPPVVVTAREIGSWNMITFYDGLDGFWQVHLVDSVCKPVPQLLEVMTTVDTVGVFHDTLTKLIVYSRPPVELEEHNDIVGLYPNPALNSATIDFGKTWSGTIELCSSQGVLLKSISIVNKSSYSLSVVDLPKGVYRLFFASSNGVSHQILKLIVSN